MYKFTDRKPQEPYKKPGKYLQFWEERVEDRETEIIILEGGGTEERIVAYHYNKYTLPWRHEFDQEAVYDEEGTLIQDSYINANLESLLAEAKG